MSIRRATWRFWSVVGLLAVSNMVLGRADEGIEYFKISPAVETAQTNKVEVVEAFSYGCPHCYQLEPQLQAWQKKLPKHATLVHFHVSFGGRPEWEMLTRAFYTAEALGVVDKIHVPMFEALHKHKRDLYSDDKMAAFFAEHGVAKQTFLDAYRSFTVDNKIQRATDLSQRYQIEGVPTLIVNGKYRTSARYTGDNTTMLKVVDELIAKEAKK